MTLYCHDAGTGKRLWEQTLSFSPSWIGRHADTLLLADGARVQCRNVSDGTLLWRVASGEWRVASGERQPPVQEQWRLASGRLFFLEEGRRLWALDAETGGVLWKRWAPGATVDPLQPRCVFYDYFHAGERWVTLQTSHGKLWVLDARTGRTVHERETARQPWPCPPLPLDERRLCLVTDFNHVVLLDPEEGKELWTRELDGPSINGTAPQVVSDGKALLLLRDSLELQRLDPRTGELIWRCGEPRWLSQRSALPWHAALDAKAVYFVRNNVLHARSLDDGKPLWERPLPRPADSWQTLLKHNALIVHPLPEEPWWRMQRPLDEPPSVLPLPRRTAFFLLFCDPKDGHSLQQLNFEGDQPGMAQWLKDGLAVGVREEVWRMRTKKEP